MRGVTPAFIFGETTIMQNAAIRVKVGAMFNKTKCAMALATAIFVSAGCAASPNSGTESAPNTLTSDTANPEVNTAAPVDKREQARLARFREGEVREYEGARLDPAIVEYDNSITGVQQVDLASYRLAVTGLVDNPEELTYDDVLALDPYERKITLNCVEGWSATVLWKGARLMDIIAAAGPAPEVNTVIFHAVDGYTTSLPLEMIKERDLILAYDANGLPLPEQMGFPFIVVAEDNAGYKWARWVSEIELSDDENYKGYWETRGYPTDAALTR